MSDAQKTAAAAGTANGSGGPDESVIAAIVDGRIKAALNDALTPITTQITELGGVVAKLGEAPKPDDKKKDSGDADAENPLAAEIAELKETVAALSGERASEKSVAARRAILLKERPGLEKYPRAITNILNRSKGDDKESVLAALADVQADYAESGIDVKPFAADYKAEGGEADATGAAEQKERAAQEAIDQSKSLNLGKS